MIDARPNINGNTPEEFTAAARQLHNAAKVVREAIPLIKRDVMDGRNYQMLANPVDSRTKDRARLSQIEIALIDMENMVFDILKASGA